MRLTPIVLLLPGCGFIVNLFEAKSSVPIDIALIDDGELAGEPVPASDLAINLYDDRLQWELPRSVDTEFWTATLLVDRALRSEGQPLVVWTTPSLFFETDGTVEVEMVVDSKDGVWMDPGFLPASIGESCSLTLEPSLTDVQFAAMFEACMVATVAERGAPLKPEITLDVVGGTATKFDFEADLVFDTSRPTEAECTGKLILPETVRNGEDRVELSGVGIGGYIAVVDAGADVVSVANTFADDPGPTITLTRSITRLEASEGAYVGDPIDLEDPIPASVDMSGTVEPTYVPEGDAWIDGSVEALTTVEGFVTVCWGVVHDQMPNETYMRFTLVGEAGLAGTE